MEFPIAIEFVFLEPALKLIPVRHHQSCLALLQIVLKRTKIFVFFSLQVADPPSLALPEVSLVHTTVFLHYLTFPVHLSILELTLVEFAIRELQLPVSFVN